MSSTAVIVNRLLERLRFIIRLLNGETAEAIAEDTHTDWGKLESLSNKINAVLNKENTSRQRLKDMINDFREILIEERRKTNDPIADAIINQKIQPLTVAKTTADVKRAKRSIDLDGRTLIEIDKVFQDVGEIYVVRFFGPLDDASFVPVIGFMRTLDALKIYRVVINLRRATTVSLKGMLPLLQHKDRCDASGGGMAFVDPPATLSALMALM